MNVARNFVIGILLGLFILTASGANADVVNYTLENVILDENDAQMTGSFSWTFDPGDFENGVGQFDFLDIPFTTHDHTDLDAVFDVGGSLEITLDANVHDDGVDITLFLMNPLTPTSGADIDISRSKYDIGGNGFHTGGFLSGRIALSHVASVGDLASALVGPLTSYPNPFNPSTTIEFEIADQRTVSLRVFDIKGRLVRTLISEERMDPGLKAIPWDGKDDRGRQAPTGTYAYSLVAGDIREVQKMVLVK